MAQLTVKINGYAYTLGCADGEEPHLQAMADVVEARVNQIRALGNQSGEGRLLVQAAVLMADELHDLRLELEQMRVARSEAAPAPAPALAEDKRMQARLAKAAARAEAIAAERG